MAPQTIARPERPATRRPLVLGLLSVFAALVVAAVVWFVLAGDGTPTATFDGDTVTYDGPTNFDAGEVTFKFDASEYEPGARFAFLPIGDDTLTEADLKALIDGVEIVGADPDWFDTDVSLPIVTLQGEADSDRIEERLITLVADTRYVLVANTFRTDGNMGHWGALIEVN